LDIQALPNHNPATSFETERRMSKVYFIGAGPGDPELITVKGQRLVAEADLVLYAGSLVPREVVACAKDGAKVADSASMTLEDTHAMLVETVRSGGVAARVHTGDPALFGAIREQIALLDRDGIEWEVVPGVTAAFASAAMAGVSFTVPEATQSLVFTRAAGRTPVPEAESITSFAAHGCSMAVYLSTTLADSVQSQLLEGGLAPETRVVVARRAGWPDAEVVDSDVAHFPAVVANKGWKGQCVFLVLPGDSGDAVSKLYDAGFSHGCRSAK
jgi:precorrin-4/cobalt-precorrin-4 C11-methyltransferase